MPQVTYWNTTDAESLRGRSRRAITDPIVYNYAYTDLSNGISLNNLTAQVEYSATIAAMNRGGFSEEESPVVSFKTAARISGVPSNINVVVYGNDAHISWQPPINPNGYIEQYEIVIQPSDSAGESATDGAETVNKDRRSREAYLMDEFKPFTYYDLKISARNRVGGGEQWEIQKFTVSAPDSKYFCDYSCRLPTVW